MKLWPFGQREARSLNPLENPTISSGSTAEDFLRFFGQLSHDVQLPPVTIESALEVPAVFDAVMFLSRTLATLPFHAFQKKDGQSERIDGDLQMLFNEAPNEEWSSFGWRQYMWQQVFTGGRGLTWIERVGSKVVGLWPMDPSLTTVGRRMGRRYYRFEGREYSAADVIDVPFALKVNQLDVYSPIVKGRKAIQLAIAMNDFAATFFGGGGVPPLALEGPMPQGVESFKRAQADIARAIEMAKQSGTPFFGMPPGHALKQIGFDPAKGQMTEARLFQLQEIARLYGLPPVFLQDLSKGTLTNTEQQDLQLVKHVIGQWAKAFEDEANLKIFGQRKRNREVRHNLDSLMRGDFKSRIEGIARAIQTSQMTPNEGRALENRPPKPKGDDLYIQGATVKLGSQAAQISHNGGPALNDNEDDPDAGTQKTDA